MPAALYFFFSHPAREISQLKRAHGQPQALSEYAWRNNIVAAARHGGKLVNFINADELDTTALVNLINEISRRLEAKQPEIPKAALSSFLLEPAYDKATLSPLTTRLYQALNSYSQTKEFGSLEETVNILHCAQSEQNGWQYVDCLDCGELSSHAARLNAQMDHGVNEKGEEFFPDSSNMLALPDNQLAWFDLLDMAEQKLVEARRNFESELFIHTDSLHRYYMHLLADERRIAASEKEQSKEKNRARRLRHKARLREILSKTSNLAVNGQ